MMFTLLIGCVGKDMKLTTQGSEAIFMNDYQSAEKYLDEALALNPENPYAVLDMGVVYENTGRKEQAISMYQKVIEMNPKGKGEQPITELARTKLKNLQMEMARNSRPAGKSYMVASEELELKDFFPSLKEPESEDSAPDPVKSNTTEKTVGPSTLSPDPIPIKGSRPSESAAPSEGASPSESAASINEIEKKVLEPLSPPPSTTEVKKADEAPTTPSLGPGKAEPAEKIYSIQIASYRSLDSAVKRIAELIESGYDAFYKKVDIKGKGTWHRIFVGKFKSKEEALQKAQSMKDQKVISDFMIKVIEG
jgi:cell division septation protein DedD